jgi:hypothetical protein
MEMQNCCAALSIPWPLFPAISMASPISKPWTNILTDRKSPKELNETFRMEIIAVEIINSIAIAKVHLPMFEFNYYDLLSLNKVDGEWVIVNKLLTHINT